MTITKIKQTDWYPERNLLITHISGDMDKSDVEEWELSLKNGLDKIQSDGTFRILVNLHGFKAVDFDAHKRFRAIIPSTLANYGWKVGYVDLFDEASTMTFSNTRGIKCMAAAHAHQDASKIELYEERFGKEDERFFTDPIEAENWISNLQFN